MPKFLSTLIISLLLFTSLAFAQTPELMSDGTAPDFEKTMETEMMKGECQMGACEKMKDEGCKMGKHNEFKKMGYHHGEFGEMILWKLGMLLFGFFFLFGSAFFVRLGWEMGGRKKK